MKRKPYKQITLYNVVAHSVFIDDNGSEDHFPIESFDNYFDWSDDLDSKLKEYNDLKFTQEDLGDADGLEKVLWCAEIPLKLWKKIKGQEDDYEHISNEVHYNFQYLKSKYIDWQSLYSRLELEKLYKEK